jgi:biopolymer transport protein ExbB/TolQ
MSLDELVHYLRLGGLTMAVIVLSSILALGVAIERMLALWGAGSKARLLGQTIARHLLRGDVAAARSAADRDTSLSADLFRAGFERAQKTVGPPLDAAVDRERQQLALKMKRGLWILGTIGATTPFVGLFGTVAGIMRSFRELGVDVESGGTGGSAAVMTGISEALVATAAGIVVAVEFVELLREAPRQPTTPSPDAATTSGPLPVTTTPAPAGGS